MGKRCVHQTTILITGVGRLLHTVPLRLIKNVSSLTQTSRRLPSGSGDLLGRRSSRMFRKISAYVLVSTATCPASVRWENAANRRLSRRLSPNKIGHPRIDGLHYSSCQEYERLSVESGTLTAEGEWVSTHVSSIGEDARFLCNCVDW